MFMYCMWTVEEGGMWVEKLCTRVVQGCRRDWFEMGHWSKLTMDDCEWELMSKSCGKIWDVDGDLFS